MADPTPPSEQPTQPVAAAASIKAAEPAPSTATAAPAAVAKPAEPSTAPVTPPVVETPAPEPVKAEAPKVEAPVVPEKYELKTDGQPLDPALTETLTPVFRDAGLTTEKAQKLVDTYAAYQKAVVPQINARDLEALRADPELGKLNFGRTQSRVNDALAAFTTPEERASLVKMGLANNLTLVRMFHRVGESMQEPGQTARSAPPVQPKSAAQKLYGGRDSSRRSN